MCPNLNSLSQSNQTAVKNFLFTNKAIYSTANDKCYKSCNTGDATNKYPNASYTECLTCDLSVSKIVANSNNTYSCVCDSSKGYVPRDDASFCSWDQGPDASQECV